MASHYQRFRPNAISCVLGRGFIVEIITVAFCINCSRVFHQLVGKTKTKPTILCDNSQTVGLIQKEEPDLKTRLRHVDIHHHWVRQESQNHHIQLQWIPTSQMPADGLTKPLPRQKHTQFVKMLGLTDIESRIHTPEDSHDGQEGQE
jgi:hypothetical protein